MSAWPEVRFEALYALPSSNGLSRPRAERGEGQRMISMGELFAYDLVGDVQMERVRMSEGEKAKFLVEPGDLLFARQSLVAEGAGKCSMVKTVNEPTTFESHLIRVRIDKTNNDPWFYYYFFRLKNNPIKAIVNQCAQAGIRGRELAQIKVPLPPLPVQRAIARRLSAYDELIENNRKRIDLLEKKAALLYKEWFVRRRFPGYDQVKRIDGLPEGWKKGTIAEVCQLKRGSNLTSSEMVTGGVPVIAAGLEPAGYHNEANVSGVSITISSSGANAGFISIHYSDIWAADCSFASEEEAKYIYFAYEMLNYLRPIIDNLKVGSAQPHVYAKDINKIKQILPSNELVAKANERLGRFHHLIANLQEQNALLAKKRDLLLPRLMSGRVTP